MVKYRLLNVAFIGEWLLMKILLVDHNIKVLEKLSRYLAPNHQISSCLDHKEALLLYSKFRNHDLVITDFIEPIIGGRDFIEHILEINSSQNFIFASFNFNKKFNAILKKSYPSAQVIRKPIDVNELNRAVRSFSLAGC